MRSFMMIMGLLFIALCQPSSAQSTAAAPAETAAPEPAARAEPAEWRDHMYELHRAIELDCRPGGAAEAPADIYTWLANGTSVQTAPALAGRYKLTEGGGKLRVDRALEPDWGNYTCLVGDTPARGFRLRMRPLLRIPEDSSVVEGQKLKLTCRVVGRPYPTVTWSYSATADVNDTRVDALTRLGARGAVQASAAGVPGAELVLDAAERADAGAYWCQAADATAVASTLRVKDMYAALWPFLGICAEVFILCAIILVYEKRRTKPELDDSDTDNHEQ